MSRQFWLAAGLATLVSWSAHAQELPEDFLISSIPNRSDKRLNDPRIVCAAGRHAAAEERAVESYGGTPIGAAEFCPAIVAEAVKRGNDADLYSAMQPGKAAVELQAVLVAAASGDSHYENAAGVRKALNCELAFDIGYIYGYANPDLPIMADLSANEIDAIIAQCFNTDEEAEVGSTMWAGARLAQRYLKSPPHWMHAPS